MHPAMHNKKILLNNLFIFGWYSPREPASLACDCEQGDLFYSAWAPRGKLRWLKLMQLKGKGRIWKK